MVFQQQQSQFKEFPSPPSWSLPPWTTAHLQNSSICDAETKAASLKRFKLKKKKYFATTGNILGPKHETCWHPACVGNISSGDVTSRWSVMTGFSEGIHVKGAQLAARGRSVNAPLHKGDSKQEGKKVQTRKQKKSEQAERKISTEERTGQHIQY